MRKIIDLSQKFSRVLFQNGEEAINLPYQKTGCGRMERITLECVCQEALPQDTRKVYLLLCGVCACGKLFVNETALADMNRTYGDLCVELTELYRFNKENTITLQCTPSKNREDCFALTSAQIIALPDSHFALNEYGIPQGSLNCTVNGSEASVQVKLNVEQANNYDVVTFRLTDLSGKTVAMQTAKPTSPTCTLTPELPVLWDGTHSPYLYTLECTLQRDANVLDSLQFSVGLNQCSVSSDGFFERNGLKFPVNGVKLNDLSQTEACIEQVLLLGADVIQTDALTPRYDLLTLCDDYGLLLWYHFRYPSLEENRDEILSLLYKLSLHPCGVFVSGDFSTAEDKLAFCRLVKQHFTRFLVCLSVDLENPDQKLLASGELCLFTVKPDLSLEDLKALPDKIQTLQQSFPLLRFAVTAQPPASYMEGTNEAPGENIVSEQIFSRWHEKVWNCFYTRKGLLCYFAGNLTDGDKPNACNGLLSHDTDERKDIFWFFRAQFSSEDFIKICSDGKTRVTEKEITLKCYTGSYPKSITVNGRTDERIKCRRISDCVYCFTGIRLQLKNNIIVVTSEHDTDSTVVYRSWHGERN